jgi:hypothetical protein
MCNSISELHRRPDFVPLLLITLLLLDTSMDRVMHVLCEAVCAFGCYDCFVQGM